MPAFAHPSKVVFWGKLAPCIPQEASVNCVAPTLCAFQCRKGGRMAKASNPRTDGDNVDSEKLEKGINPTKNNFKKKKSS